MNEPQLTQNMRLGVLGVSQLQQSIVREGTTGTRGAPGGPARSAGSAGLCLAVTNFGIAVPSAPGAVGVFEAACSGALAS